MRSVDLSLATRSSNITLGSKLGVLLKPRTGNLRKGSVCPGKLEMRAYTTIAQQKCCRAPFQAELPP